MTRPTQAILDGMPALRERLGWVRDRRLVRGSVDDVIGGNFSLIRRGARDVTLEQAVAAAAVFDAPPPAPAQAPTGPAPVCDEHGLEMRFRPAGVSQRTGKPYTAFWGCQERGCKITARA